MNLNNNKDTYYKHPFILVRSSSQSEQELLITHYNGIDGGCQLKEGLFWEKNKILPELLGKFSGRYEVIIYLKFQEVWHILGIPPKDSGQYNIPDFLEDFYYKWFCSNSIC